MSQDRPEVIIEKLFKQLRPRDRFNLGLQEYLAALDALEGGLVETSDDASGALPTLKTALKLLWCQSTAQQKQFDELWKRIVPVAEKKVSPKVEDLSVEAEESPAGFRPDRQTVNHPPSEQAPVSEPETNFNLAPLPVRSPIAPLDIDRTTDLEAYWPVTRRSMSYFWRYLRRPRADGPLDVLDLRQTVELAAQRGIFLEAVYRRREVNHAHLVLFIDREGSMMPLHRFTRDIVETAQADKTLFERLGVYYFYNVPRTHVYEDSALSKPVLLSQILEHFDNDTSVLIVSDAGAARGQRQMRRLRETARFIALLKQRTTLIGWLNPMPRDRWADTTAGLLRRLVPMAQMDGNGFSYLIDVVRGQPLAETSTGQRSSGGD